MLVKSKIYLILFPILAIAVILANTSCNTNDEIIAERSQSVTDFIKYVEVEQNITFSDFGRGEWEPSQIIDHGEVSDLADKYGYATEYLQYPIGVMYASGDNKVKVDDVVIDRYNLLPDSHILNPKQDRKKYKLLDNTFVVMLYYPDVSYIIPVSDFVKLLKIKPDANMFVYSQQDDTIYFILEPYLP